MNARSLQALHESKGTGVPWCTSIHIVIFLAFTCNSALNDSSAGFIAEPSAVKLGVSGGSLLSFVDKLHSVEVLREDDDFICTCIRSMERLCVLL